MRCTQIQNTFSSNFISDFDLGEYIILFRRFFFVPTRILPDSLFKFLLFFFLLSPKRKRKNEKKKKCEIIPCMYALILVLALWFHHMRQFTSSWKIVFYRSMYRLHNVKPLSRVSTHSRRTHLIDEKLSEARETTYLLGPSRGCLFLFFSLFLIWLFSAAISLSMREPMAHANFYPSPHDLWISVFASISFYCFTFFGRLLFDVGLFTFNSMRCLVSPDVITSERSSFFSMRVVNTGLRPQRVNQNWL